MCNLLFDSAILWLSHINDIVHTFSTFLHKKRKLSSLYIVRCTMYNVQGT